MEVFDTNDAATVAQVPLSTLRDWIDAKLITPSIRPSSGQGKDMLFSFKDIAIAGIVGAARRQGIKIDDIKLIAKELARCDFDRALPYIVLHGGNVVFTDAPEPFLKVPMCVILNLPRCIELFRALVAQESNKRSKNEQKAASARKKLKRR